MRPPNKVLRRVKQTKFIRKVKKKKKKKARTKIMVLPRPYVIRAVEAPPTPPKPVPPTPPPVVPPTEPPSTETKFIDKANETPS